MYDAKASIATLAQIVHLSTHTECDTSLRLLKSGDQTHGCTFVLRYVSGG